MIIETSMLSLILFLQLLGRSNAVQYVLNILLLSYYTVYSATNFHIISPLGLSIMDTTIWGVHYG